MTTHVLRGLTTAAWSVLVPFLLTACSTYAPLPPADEHDATEAGLSLGQFCQRLPDAHCRWQIDCDGGVPGGCDVYADEYARQCEAVGASLAAGRIVFDRPAAAACLEKLVDGSCLEVAETCRVFVGQVPAGEACDPNTGPSPIDEISGDECAAGICSPRYMTLPATCRGLVGDECSNYPGASGCGPGTFCDYDSAPSTCAPLLQEGQPCRLGACGEGLRCVGDPPACARTLAEGAECEDSTQCTRSSVCAGGHCRRKASRGDACLGDHNCPPGDQCVKLDGDESQPGTCLGGMTGDPCWLNRYGASYDCRRGYSCVATGTSATTCQPVDGLPCEYDYICYPFWCKYTSSSGGICTRPGEEGDVCVDLRSPWEEPPYYACRDDLECRDGLCQ